MARSPRQRGTRAETPETHASLTIDARLQISAEDALDKASNSGATLSPRPAQREVLVLASRPTFNPNVWSLARNSSETSAVSCIQQNPNIAD
jgi:cell division protein FtsI/penicillin-binding protein 2